MINKMIKKYSNEVIKIKTLGQKKSSFEIITTKTNSSNNLKDFTQQIIQSKNNNNSKSRSKNSHKPSNSIIEINNENRNVNNMNKAANFNFDSNKLRKNSNSNKNEKKEQTTNPDSKKKVEKFFSFPVSNPVCMDVDYPLNKNEKEPDLSVIEEKNNSPKFDETVCSDELKLSLNKAFELNEYVTNPQVPYEYIRDILENLLKEELVITVKYDSMKNQSDINDKMRAILIDWLIDVHLKFKLLPESLFLTINIIDRFITKKQVLRSKLQLLGIASLLIACKYEEIYSPELRDFVYITDKAFSKADIISMEEEILFTLSFEITVPSILRFLEIFAITFKFNEKDFALAKYLVEIFLIDFRINRYSSSLVATTATYIVLKLNRHNRINEIYDFSKKTESQLKECAKDILFLIQNIEGSVLQAVRKKYSSSKFYEVSKIRFC